MSWTQTGQQALTSISMSDFETVVRGRKKAVLLGKSGRQAQAPCEACLSMLHKNHRFLKAKATRLDGSAEGNVAGFWGEMGVGGEGSSGCRRRRRRRRSGGVLAGVLALALVVCCPTSAYG